MIDDLVAGIAFDPEGGETGPHTLDEVSTVPFRLKTEEIIGQKRMNDLGSPGKPHKKIPWREGNMQEKCFLGLDFDLFKISAHHQQVVIMDPYEISGSGF